MKIVIKINKDICKDKEQLKRMIDRENFNEQIKASIDNGVGLNIVNWKGDWCYTITVKKEKGE